MAKRKLVFVEIESKETSNLSYEIEIDNSEQSGQSDVDYVVDVLKKKNRRLDTALRPGKFAVLVRSQHRPDKLVNKGDYTPIKNNSDVIIRLSARTDVESMDIDGDEVSMSSRSQDGNNNMVNEDSTSDTDSICEAAAVCEPVQGHCHQSPNNESRCTAVDNKAKYSHVRVPLDSLALPSFNSLVTDKLIKKEPLNSSEYCHVTRELGRDIKKITLHPHPEAYRHMSKMFLTAYPHLALKNGGLERTVEMITKAMKRNFEYERSNAKQTFSNKGGRPSFEKTSKGPKRILVDTGEFDAVSYGQHVEKLLEMIANDGDIGGIEALYKETFTGRRHFVQGLSVTDLTTIFKEHCPLLRQVKYLNEEMDLLLGEGTCDLALQNWRQTIDKIIEVAKKSSNTAIVKTKKQYAQEDMNDFEIKSRFALECIPFLVKGSKRGIESRKLFYDRRPANTSLKDVIGSGTSYPYIVSIGNRFHIVVGRKAYFEVKSSLEAMVNLLCTHYVFNIQYNPEVRPAFHFLQHRIIMQEDAETKACKELGIFLSLVN